MFSSRWRPRSRGHRPLGAQRYPFSVSPGAVCQYCAVDGMCIHSVGNWGNSPCACEQAGVSTCPVCQHGCEPWYSGLTIPGRDDLVQYFMDSRDQLAFPATKSQLLGALQAVDPSLPNNPTVGPQFQWFARALPDRTYSDIGEAMIAVAEPVTAPPEPAGGSSPWRAAPGDEWGAGQRVIVPEGQALVLERDGRAYDHLPAGTHVLDATSCPRIALVSRQPARPGGPTSYRAHLLYVSTAPFTVPFSFMSTNRLTAPPAPGQRPPPVIAVQGSATVAVRDAGLFVEKVRQTERGGSDRAAEVRSLLEAALRTAVEGADPNQLEERRAALTQSAGAALESMGLAVSELRFGALGPPTPEMMMQMRSQMVGMASMAAAARASRSMSPGPTTTPAQPPGPTAPAGAPCARCGHGNPPGSRFCLQCGTPLGVPAAPLCPSCGRANPPGSRFCLACGAALGPT
jgi:hypothetical protein